MARGAKLLVVPRYHVTLWAAFAIVVLQIASETLLARQCSSLLVLALFRIVFSPAVKSGLPGIPGGPP